MKKILFKIQSFLLSFSYNYEKLFRKIWFKVRVNRVYNYKSQKIRKEYKQAIRKYWQPYVKNINIRYHKMYTYISGREDIRYIPDDIYFSKIMYYFNKVAFSKAIDDKNYYNILLSELKQPKTIIHNVDNIFYDSEYNIIKQNDALKMIYDEIKENGEIILKPAIETSGGKNIAIINENMNINEVLNEYKDNFIIQRIIKQSEELSEIHKQSVNTIRTISLLYNHEVKILSSILRMGINNSRIDNFSAGGISCGINDDGTLKKNAYDKSGREYNRHPQGIKFEGYKIKGYEKIVNEIKRTHKKFGHFKIISWDFTISENYEPILIEFNLTAGQIDFHQFNNGPLFGDLTEKILKEVFLKKI